jgi:hypothetical protein
MPESGEILQAEFRSIQSFLSFLRFWVNSGIAEIPREQFHHEQNCDYGGTMIRAKNFPGFSSEFWPRREAF